MAPPLSVLVLVAMTVMPALAQYRPSYFPRPGGLNLELPQYGGQQAGQSGQQGGQTQAQGGQDGDVGNRDNAPSTLPPLPPPGSSGAGEDTQLANRVTEWPRPHQPFWLLNQQHINQHIGRPGQDSSSQGQQGQQQGVGASSSSSQPAQQPAQAAQQPFIANRNRSPYFSG